MKFRPLTFVVLACLSLSPALAQEPGAIEVVTAQPLSPAKVTATGRIVPLVSARLGLRVSGHIRAWGKDEQGRLLDAGMFVKADQVLLQLDDTTFQNTVASAEAALRSAQAVLANLTAKTRAERLEQLRQAVVEYEVRLLDRRRDEERYRRLVEQDKTLPEKRLEEVRMEMRVLEAQLKGAQARLQEAENGPTPSEVALAQARVNETEAALKTARDDFRDATLRAPYDGLITRRYKSPGDYVTSAPFTEVLEIVRMDKLEAELHLPEAYLRRVQAGQTMVKLGSALLREALTLPVARVIGEIDPAKGTFAFRVAIPAEQRGDLASGAFVTGEVELNGRNRGALIPLRAVVAQDGKSYVFVAADGRMTRRQVQLGDRLTEAVIVTDGLAAGEKIVVGAAGNLRDGAALTRPAER